MVLFQGSMSQTSCIFLYCLEQATEQYKKDVLLIITQTFATVGLNVNSTTRQRQLPIAGVHPLPRPPCETARDVRVKCVHKTHFSDAFH